MAVGADIDETAGDRAAKKIGLGALLLAGAGLVFGSKTALYAGAGAAAASYAIRRASRNPTPVPVTQPASGFIFG
jgi:hypothetical protein